MLVAVVSERAVDEPAGLARVFQEHHGRVYRAAYRITGNSQDAEDILQTVFLRLAQKGDLAAENAASYLYRAAVNASIDLIRARKSTAPLEEADRAVRSDQTPERARERGEIRDWLRRALAALPAQSAEMFALRYLEGYGNLEIARMLGVSRVRVGVVLHRTRHRLRRELRQRKGI
jgi:RNA polymerase sigma-70 factor (ECF subfamily)